MLSQAFLSPTSREAVRDMLGDLGGTPQAAALFCGWGAEIHLMLEAGVGEVLAVDQLAPLINLLLTDLGPEKAGRVRPHVTDALAFLLMAPANLPLITALGGGPSYVGQGALLAAMQKKLAPGGVALVGDLAAKTEVDRGRICQLFELDPSYVMTLENYRRLIGHAGFDIAAETFSTPGDWRDYFTRMNSYRGMDVYPFNDPAFFDGLEKEADVMLTPAPPAHYVTFKLVKR